MHPVAQRELEEAREAIAALCRRYGVRRLWIFGSATGEGFDPERSDYDFLAEYGGRPDDIGPLDLLVMLPEQLASVLRRDVDVVDTRGVARKNEFFQRSVERTKREVYAAEDRLVARC